MNNHKVVEFLKTKKLPIHLFTFYAGNFEKMKLDKIKNPNTNCHIYYRKEMQEQVE